MEFTDEKTQQLRDEYNKAVEQGKDSFTFHGRELVTDYAKYLLQYLTGQYEG